MPRIQRKTQKIFAGGADADQIAVFGSMKSGTPDYSSDLDDLQSADYAQGWADAILSDKAPYLEEMNGVQYGFSSQLAYLMQEGIPEYDSGTTYYKNSIVKDPDTTNAVVLYTSLTDGNVGNPLTDAVNWQKLNIAGGAIGQPQFTLDFNTLPDNCIWLEGATVSRTTYAALFAIYGTTYGAGDGSTTFKLPDFRNRVLWGADTAGYLSAGLPNITGNVGQLRTWTPSPWSSGALGFTNLARIKAFRDGSVDQVIQINFNASWSNSIYGAASTVRPPSLKVRVYTRYQ